MLSVLSPCRLSVPSLRRSDAGLYQCTVRNRMGALIHRRTEVQVACEYSPSVKHTHDSALFSCESNQSGI